MGGRQILLAVAVLAASLVAAPVAQASFHFISVREVYPGSAASPESGYVELQMYVGGQQFVGGHTLTVYDGAGTTTGSFTFPSGLPNGANQQTILIGDSGVQAAFGVAPDLVDADFEAAAAGGAACWDGTLDCVAWGSFGGAMPSPVGSPADPGGIPDGMALRRSIAPGCATLLEAGDDSNVSAADFFDAGPQPRNNASPIVETACAPPPDTTPPIVTIDSHPADPSSGTAATFTYHANEAGASFECSLVAGSGPDAFAACSRSGHTYNALADGAHTFKVRAEDAAGNLGQAKVFAWTVDNSLADATPPATEAGGAPPDPGGDSTAAPAPAPPPLQPRAARRPPGTRLLAKPRRRTRDRTPTLRFRATVRRARFQCSVDRGRFRPCRSPFTTRRLRPGRHRVRVRAVAGGRADPTPARAVFRVLGKRKRKARRR